MSVIERERGLAAVVIGEERPLVDMRWARAACEMSARAYNHDVTFESEFAHVVMMTADWEGAPITWLVFRGTQSMRDIVTDAAVAWSYTEFGRVHSGWWRSMMSVFDRVVEFVRETVPGRPLVITGHSKGGAEAVLCARRLAAMGVPILRVVTFGGPRVGDARWKQGYNSQAASIEHPTSNIQHPTLGDVTERWVHEEDIVARVPAWITGYRHVGSEYFISSFGGVQVNPPLWLLAMSDLWGTFWGYRHGEIEQLTDHPIAKYQRHLSNL